MTDSDILLAAVRAQARALKLPTVARESETLARRLYPRRGDRCSTFGPCSMPSWRPAQNAPSSDAPRRPVASAKDTRTIRLEASARARARTRGVSAGVRDRQSRNVVLLGPVGTGKTHLATALGIEAIKRGHHVAFFRASDLVRALTEARDARVLSRLQERLRRVSLLIVDELGFVPFEKAGGEMLFDVLSTRHERGATVMTSNLAFSEWNRVFVDDKLTAALLDRLAQHADVLVTRGPGDRAPAAGKRGEPREEKTALTA